MADALSYGATPYTFPPLYPTTNDSMDVDNTDYVGKYRDHAELFQVGSTTRSAVPASLSSSSSMVNHNLSYDPRPPASSWLGWSQQDPNSTDLDVYQQQRLHPPVASLSPISSSMHMPVNGNNHPYFPSVRYA